LEPERVLLHCSHVPVKEPYLEPQIRMYLGNQHQNNVYKISSFRKVLCICTSTTADVTSQETAFMCKTTATSAYFVPDSITHDLLIATCSLLNCRKTCHTLRASDNLKLVFYRLLGAFAKLRKATVSFVTSVCLSVRMEQVGSHWTDFHEI
jgi:hypothetical protein